MSNVDIWHIEFLLLITLLFYLFKYFQNNLKTEEYTTLNHSMSTIVSVYKTKIYLPKYKKLVQMHDLDENSQTNSNKFFTIQLNALLNESCNDIIKNYLSATILTKLYKYYSVDGIIVTILSILED